jgi:hypothetical protein
MIAVACQEPIRQDFGEFFLTPHQERCQWKFYRAKIEKMAIHLVETNLLYGVGSPFLHALLAIYRAMHNTTISSMQKWQSNIPDLPQSDQGSTSENCQRDLHLVRTLFFWSINFTIIYGICNYMIHIQI